MNFPRLYTKYNNLIDGVEFQFKTIKIYEDGTLDISLNQQTSKNKELFTLLPNYEDNDLLYQMNKEEYKRINLDISKHKEIVEDLNKTSPSDANKQFGKLFCFKSFKEQFQNWFKEAGYNVEDLE